MFATDPLSLAFLGCILFSLVFLLLASVLGGGHGLHLGGHAGVAHMSGASSGHAAAAHLHAGHAAQLSSGAAHTAQLPPAAAHAQTSAAPAARQSLGAALEGALSVFGLLTFLLVFGLVGYLFHTLTSVVLAFVLLVAVVAGVVAAVAISTALNRLFVETALDPATSRLEGRLATVSSVLRPGSIGEIVYSSETAGRQSVSARSVDDLPIPVDTEVVILEYAHGVATVQSWDSFAAEVRASDTSREHRPPPLD